MGSRSLPVNVVYFHGCTWGTLKAVERTGIDAFLYNAKHFIEKKPEYNLSTASDPHTRAIENTRSALIDMRLRTVFCSTSHVYIVVTHEAFEHTPYDTRLLTYVGVSYGDKQLIVRGLDTARYTIDSLNRNTDDKSIGLALSELAGWILDGVLPIGIRESTNPK